MQVIVFYVVSVKDCETKKEREAFQLCYVFCLFVHQIKNTVFYHVQSID